MDISSVLMTCPSFPRASIELVETEVSELETRLEKVTKSWRKDPRLDENKRGGPRRQ